MSLLPAFLIGNITGFALGVAVGREKKEEIRRFVDEKVQALDAFMNEEVRPKISEMEGQIKREVSKKEQEIGITVNKVERHLAKVVESTRDDIMTYWGLVPVSVPASNASGVATTNQFPSRSTEETSERDLSLDPKDLPLGGNTSSKGTEYFQKSSRSDSECSEILLFDLDSEESDFDEGTSERRVATSNK